MPHVYLCNYLARSAHVPQNLKCNFKKKNVKKEINKNGKANNVVIIEIKEERKKLNSDTKRLQACNRLQYKKFCKHIIGYKVDKNKNHEEPFLPNSFIVKIQVNFKFYGRLKKEPKSIFK